MYCAVIVVAFNPIVSVVPLIVVVDSFEDQESKLYPVLLGFCIVYWFVYTKFLEYVPVVSVLSKFVHVPPFVSTVKVYVPSSHTAYNVSTSLVTIVFVPTPWLDWSSCVVAHPLCWYPGRLAVGRLTYVDPTT